MKFGTAIFLTLFIFLGSGLSAMFLDVHWEISLPHSLWWGWGCLTVIFALIPLLIYLCKKIEG